MSNSNFYLEKTLSHCPSDVAHLLKYLYYSRIRFDTKHWYYFKDHRWIISDEDQCPLIGLMRNDLVNRYLTLATEYNNKVREKTCKLTEYPDENPDDMDEYLPLIVNDLIYKSKLCSEMSLKLSSDTYYQKVILSAQGLFTQKDFLLTMDQNPDLIGFNNGIYNLKTHQLDVCQHTHKVLMSTGYEYHSEMHYENEICKIFEDLALLDFLPELAGLLKGDRRQPLLWINNLTETSMYALTQLIHWTLGDYQGFLDFKLLRKRKIPSGQNHTHNEIIDNCKKRIVLVEQHPEDCKDVSNSIVETLLCARSLNLRRPHELNDEYIPQFGLIVLSCKADSEPMIGSKIFTANNVEIEVNELWKRDFIKILFNYLKI